MPFDAFFLGGPVHGETRTIDEDLMLAPPRIEFPTEPTIDPEADPSTPIPSPGTAIYTREAMADIPGSVAYVYDEKVSS